MSSMRPDFLRPFPLVSTWVHENEGPARAIKYDQYRYIVEYHFFASWQAASACVGAVHHFHDRRFRSVSANGRLVSIRQFEPESIIRQGDLAVREAASSLEMALQLVNFVLKFRINKRSMRWGERDKNGNLKKDEQLRKQLLKSPHSHARSLEATLDRVYSSVGYDLLSGYRNWVTHRSAPQVMVPESFSVIPLPDAFMEVTDSSELVYQIDKYLIQEMLPKIKVYSYAIAPPIQSRLSYHIEHADDDMDLPGGIYIGKGAQNITIDDMRFVRGSMFDDLQTFKANNPVPLVDERILFAGDYLEVYPATDYVSAVDNAAEFVRDVLTSVLDKALYSVLVA